MVFTTRANLRTEPTSSGLREPAVSKVDSEMFHEMEAGEKLSSNDILEDVDRGYWLISKQLFKLFSSLGHIQVQGDFSSNCLRS